jgi:uncharacterized protein (UPF0147 family)
MAKKAAKDKKSAPKKMAMKNAAMKKMGKNYVIMAKKLTMQQKSERGRSERRVVAQTARKVRDKKEDAAIAKANAMLDEMMRDGTIHIRRSSKSKARNE